MRKNTKNTLVTSGVFILLAVCIFVSFKFGSILSGLSAILLCELFHNFWFVPVVVKNFYILHEMEEPSFLLRMLPLYNQTLVISPKQVLTYGVIFLIDVIFYLVITFLGGTISNYLNIGTAVKFLETAPLLLVFVTMISIIALSCSFGVSVSKINKLYEDELLSKNNINAVINFLGTNGIVIILSLPVLRAIGSYMLMTKSQDLIKLKIKFD